MANPWMRLSSKRPLTLVPLAFEFRDTSPIVRRLSLWPQPAWYTAVRESGISELWSSLLAGGFGADDHGHCGHVPTPNAPPTRPRTP